MIKGPYQRKSAISMITLLFLIGFSSGAYAFTCTWTGAVDSDSLKSGNWTGCNGGIPLAGDDVVFDNNTSSANCTWNIVPLLSSFSIINSYSGTVTIGAVLNIEGDITVNSGNLNAGSSTITVGGDWIISGRLNTDLGDLNENGTIEMADVAEVLLMAMDTEPLHTCSDINGDGTVDILDAVKTLRMSDVHNLDSTQPCTGGTFIAGTSSVVLNGFEQVIYGNNTFYDLTKILVLPYDTLFFEAGRVQTIVNNLTLQGLTNTMLSLRSTIDDEYWYIDPQGNRILSFASIKDASNINFVDIVTTNSDDAGNNPGLNFGGSLCVCRDEKLVLARMFCGDWGERC